MVEVTISGSDEMVTINVEGDVEININESNTSPFEPVAYEVGETVADQNPPSWSHGDLIEVTEITETRCDEYQIGSKGETVSFENPYYDGSERVVRGKYVGGSDKEYSFPASRLQRI